MIGWLEEEEEDEEANKGGEGKEQRGNRGKGGREEKRRNGTSNASIRVKETDRADGQQNEKKEREIGLL